VGGRSLSTEEHTGVPCHKTHGQVPALPALSALSPARLHPSHGLVCCAGWNPARLTGLRRDALHEVEHGCLLRLLRLLGPLSCRRCRRRRPSGHMLLRYRGRQRYRDTQGRPWHGCRGSCRSCNTSSRSGRCWRSIRSRSPSIVHNQGCQQRPPSLHQWRKLLRCQPWFLRLLGRRRRGWHRTGRYRR